MNILSSTVGGKSGMTSKNIPYFIVLEGIDNAGKTTVAKKLKEWLERSGYKAVISKEFSSSYGDILKPSCIKNHFLQKKRLFYLH